MEAGHVCIVALSNRYGPLPSVTCVFGLLVCGVSYSIFFFLCFVAEKYQLVDLEMADCLNCREWVSFCFLT